MLPVDVNQYRIDDQWQVEYGILIHNVGMQCGHSVPETISTEQEKRHGACRNGQKQKAIMEGYELACAHHGAIDIPLEWIYCSPCIGEARLKPHGGLIVMFNRIPPTRRNEGRVIPKRRIAAVES